MALGGRAAQVALGEGSATHPPRALKRSQTRRGSTPTGLNEEPGRYIYGKMFIYEINNEPLTEYLSCYAFYKNAQRASLHQPPPFLGYPKVWGTTTQCTTYRTSVGVVSPRGVAPRGGGPPPPSMGRGGEAVRDFQCTLGIVPRWFGWVWREGEFSTRWR